MAYEGLGAQKAGRGKAPGSARCPRQADGVQRAERRDQPHRRLDEAVWAAPARRGQGLSHHRRRALRLRSRGRERPRAEGDDPEARTPPRVVSGRPGAHSNDLPSDVILGKETEHSFARDAEHLTRAREAVDLAGDGEAVAEVNGALPNSVDPIKPAALPPAHPQALSGSQRVAPTPSTAPPS